MLSELPDLVNQKIVEFLPTTICCKNFLDLNIMVTNKYFRDFIKDHLKYTFLNDTIIVNRNKKTKKILKTSIKTYNGKLCCHCTKLDTNEQNKLQNLLNRYESVSLYNLPYNKKINNEYKKYVKNYYDNNTNTNKYKDELSMLNIHFNTSLELTNFIIKMDKIKSNLWFDPRRCCNGSGCNVEIVI